MSEVNLSEETARKLVGLIIGGYILIIGLIIGQWYVDYGNRKDRVVELRQGCERGKLDRTSTANAFRAQSDYLNLVLEARSVKQDVKDAAEINQGVQNTSASDLETRTGEGFDCTQIFKPASLLPGG